MPPENGSSANSTTTTSTSTTAKLSLPLSFQQDIFHLLRQEDVLLIMASGLGLLRIVTNLIHAYDVAGSNLVLILGATEQENDWIGESLAEQAVVSAATNARGLNNVNTQLSTVPARQKLYARGGIISVTGQIAILDLLAGALKAETVTGIIVLHAERVSATSVEAFVLRIYRQGNRDGFIKAFSEEPERFNSGSGLSPLTTMLRNLFLRKPVFYPRFQVDVAQNLMGNRKAEVIELEIELTDAMRTIQTAILECVEASVSELKRAATGIDMSDWNVDTALASNFYVRVMTQLKPVWHRLHPKTKQVANDLRLLHSMLAYLLNLDAVKFLQYLDTVIAASQPPQGMVGNPRFNVSPWLMLDAASTVFETAKHRVYSGKMGNVNAQINQESLKPVLEELPKWAVLQELLEEIERDAYFNPVVDDSTGTILVMCGDQSTCAQLREYLQTMEIVDEEDDDGRKSTRVSGSSMMKRRLTNYILWKREFTKVGEKLYAEDQKKGGESSNSATSVPPTRGNGPPNKRRRTRAGAMVASGSGRFDAFRTAGDKDAHLASLISGIGSIDDLKLKEEVGADPLQNMDAYYQIYDMNDLVLIHPYQGDLEEHILEEVKPRYIIMYEPSASFVRRIEVYRSSHTNRNVRVYFMYYEGSVEESHYNSSVRKEKDAFSRLIRERANMALTIDNVPAGSIAPDEAYLRTVNTRIAGGGRTVGRSATSIRPRVIVDTREFRSSLPSLIDARGSSINSSSWGGAGSKSTQIIPCMLKVGDYVLTPDLVVERKSVSDLISSLNNGRLYGQAEMMVAHYKHAMLLIEFEQTRSFTLEPFSDLLSNSSTTSGAAAAAAMGTLDLQSKLVLLMLAFPTLRIIWSTSAYQTAEIFEELKRDAAEPDPAVAVSIGGGGDVGDEISGGVGVGVGAGGLISMWNKGAMDMLREIPGVTERNAHLLAASVKNVHELANLDEDELGKMVGQERGRKIWAFFNKRVTEE